MTNMFTPIHSSDIPLLVSSVKIIDFVCVLRIIIATLDVDLHPKYNVNSTLHCEAFCCLVFFYLLLINVIFFNGEKANKCALARDVVIAHSHILISKPDSR